MNYPHQLNEQDFLSQASELRKRRIVFWGTALGTPLLTFFLLRKSYFVVFPTIFGFYLGNNWSRSTSFNIFSPNSDLILTKAPSVEFMRHFLESNGIPYVEDTSTYSKISKTKDFTDRYFYLENKRYK